MYEEVLKFGAMIVDHLRTFKHPVFIYIPPKCELRGGAWVVVDPTINPEMMELYADEDCRGGVLEAEGTVEVKFRRKALEDLMARVDAVYRDLRAQHRAAGNEAARREVQEKLYQRYNLLEPMYHTVAVKFADLHDTPGRMKHKNCVNKVLKWAESRTFFYWRLRRRLAEEVLRSKVCLAKGVLRFSALASETVENLGVHGADIVSVLCFIFFLPTVSMAFSVDRLRRYIQSCYMCR